MTAERALLEDVQAGLARLHAVIDDLDPAALEAVRQAGHADAVREQPWLIAGCSDGMGLQTTLAAIEAGVLRRGVAVYHEPPSFLGRDAAGAPRSPVHYARYQNALALAALAEQRGVALEVISADLCLAPQRGLRGEVKGAVRPLPEPVVAAVEVARAASSVPDVVLLDSVAFAKWICPRADAPEPIAVPSVAFDGSIVTMKTKPYHARGYAETLDTMGRNHAWLLDAARELGWLGERALTAFLTWAGGSQNVQLLEGIYGRGALGDAKVVAEEEVVRFRLTHGLTHGAHAVVRLPAFLSAALMGIPGGGLFGLVERRVLQDVGLQTTLGELAVGTLRGLLGTGWVRENPLAQIELDTAEVLHLGTIRDHLDAAHARIAAHRETLGSPDAVIPAAEAREVLAGLVPEDTAALLARFEPNLAAPRTAELTLDGPALGDGAAVWPDRLYAATADAATALADAGELAIVSEAITIDSVPAASDRIQVRLRAVSTGGSLRVRREFRAAGATRPFAVATATFAEPGAEALPDPEQLGEPIGYRMTLQEPALSPPQLAAWAEDQLRRLGLAPRGVPARRDVRFGRAPATGDRVLAFAGRDGGRQRVTVVDDAMRAIASIWL